jgi:predicted PurR-regulated permease PerM
MFVALRLFINAMSAVTASAFALFLLFVLSDGLLTIDAPIAFSVFISYLITPFALWISNVCIDNARSRKSIVISVAWVLWCMGTAAIFAIEIFSERGFQPWTHLELFWASLVSWMLPLLANGIHLYRQLQERRTPNNVTA